MTINLLPGVVPEEITPPTLAGHILDRTHLLEYINQSAPRAVIVMAPEGFGKTSLGVQWHAQNPGRTVWFTGTFSDTAEMMLNRMVCAIRQVETNFAPWYDAKVFAKSTVDENTIKVCEDIGKLGYDLNFVIDSLEKVPNATMPFVQTWANHIPTNVRTLSLRRNPPLNSYTRPMDLGVLRYMTASDLAFSKEEVLSLASAMNLEMSEGEILALVEKLHGWPAATYEILSYLGKSEHWVFGTPEQESKPEVVLPKGKTGTADHYPEATIKDLVGQLARKIFHGPIGKGKDSSALTARELQILRLLDSALTVEKIGSTLHLSKNTVKTHLKNIYTKLDVDTRIEAVTKARENHLI